MKSYNAGDHDPYWYESFIGLKYILEMLETDSGIEAVAFQSTMIDKLDDVVVKYKDDRLICVQIKHTRVKNNLTLSDLIRPIGSSDSLIRGIAAAWREGSKNELNCIPVLYTNRKLGTNPSSISDGSVYPPLATFWTQIQNEMKRSDKLSDIQLDPTLGEAWNELLMQLSIVGSDTNKYEFLKNLQIKSNQPELDQLEKQMIEKIGQIFGIAYPSMQSDIFDKLAGSLRHWTTSIHGKMDFVNPEEVYRRLSLSLKLEDNEHRLPPPVPFFKSRMLFMERLIEELASNKQPVIFLKGSPGCGKSSLVSQLADESSTVIDLRYHAFKPITPDMKEIPADANRLVGAETFWTAMLDQIRMKFEGKRFRYRVPIRSNYLTVAQIKEHVLRLAQELSIIQNKPTVIAIDGIDHAARSGYISHKHENTFLHSLVHPEEVPDGIVFLLAGQPPEGYPAYPHWLREDRDDVLHLEVPTVTESDIRQMLTPHFPRDFMNPAIKVIRETAADNTLAVVFAVREAMGCNSVEELVERLQSKKLHDGIHAYYDHIWIHAVRKIQEKVSHEIAYLNEKLSGCFSLSSERLDGITLQGIFSDSQLTAVDWNYLLKDLEPLVTEQEKGKFVLFHNDVRVYFMRYIRTRPDIVKDVAGSLADFYLAESEYKIARHADLFSLLNLSKRSKEIVSIFNPSYIMEAWAIRRPVEEIRAQCGEMLATVKQQRNWDDMGVTLEAIRTVQQLLSSHNMANERNYIIEEDLRDPAFLPSEGVVKPIKEWNIHLLKNVLIDIRKLAKHNKFDRARQVMERWFQRDGISPFKLMELLRKYEVYESSSNHDKPRKRFLEWVRDYGEVAGLISAEVWQIHAMDLGSLAKKQVASTYCDGFLQESLHSCRFSFFKYLRRYLPLLEPEKKIALAERMVDRERWTEIRYLLKNTEAHSLIFQHRIMLGMFSAIVNFETDRFVIPVVDQGFDILEHMEMTYATDAKLYSCVCFLSGWTSPESNLEQLASEAMEAYNSVDRDPRAMNMVHFLVHSTCRMGAYYRLSMEAEFKLSKLDIYSIISLIAQLYIMDKNVYGHLVGYIEVRSFFMKMAMYLSGKDEELDKVLHPVIRDSMLAGDVFYLDMDLVWGYLDLHGDRKAMEIIFHRWVGEEGTIWGDDIQIGVPWIEKFIALADKYQMEERARYLKDKLAWRWFGMTARRSVSIGHVVRWVELLLKIKPTLWKHQGLALLDICRQLGSEPNQVTDSAVSIVMAAAAKDGVETLWSVFNENDMLDVSKFTHYKVIFDVLILMLKDCSIKEDDLTAIWLLTIGGLSWRDRNSRAYIEDMRKSVLKAAHRLGYTDLAVYMKQETSYHFDIHNDRDRDNRPVRWFETRRKHLSHWESTRKLVEHKVRKLSLEEAFSDFHRFVRTLDPDGGEMDHVKAFYFAEILVRKLSKEPSHKYKEYSEILFEFAGDHAAILNYNRSDSYIEEFYSTFIGFALDDETRWRVLEPLIPETIEVTTLSYFINKLEEMLQVRAEEIGSQKIEASTNQVIDTYERWFRGDVKVASTYSMENSMNQMSWKQFTLKLLLRNLSSGNEHQIEAALQGLWLCVKRDNQVIHNLISEWDTIGESAREWILLLFERIASEFPSYYESMKPLLLKLKTEGMMLRTQSNVIIETFERGLNVTGRSTSPWLLRKIKGINSYFSKVKERTEVQIFDYPLFEDRFFNQRLYQISSLFPELVTELLVEFDASEDTDVNMETKLLQIIESRIEKETWERTSVYNEVRAYLPCDDPFLLLNPPSSFRRSDGWLKTGLIAASKFDTALKFDEVDAIAQFMSQAEKGLNKDHILLGAAMFHFNLIEGYYFTSRLSESEGYNQFTSSGRSFLFYNSEPIEKKDLSQELFYTFRHINGQKIPYSSTVLLVPSTVFRSLGWLPSTANPLVWEKQGKRMMWMEQIFSPYLEEVQPFLQRWVCTREGYQEINRVKRNLNYIVTVEPFLNNFSMMDLPNNVRIYR